MRVGLLVCNRPCAREERVGRVAVAIRRRGRRRRQSLTMGDMYICVGNISPGAAGIEIPGKYCCFELENLPAWFMDVVFVECNTSQRL